MERNVTKEYNYGLDIIRIIAMILVVTVHSTTFNNWAEIKHDVNIINFLVTAVRFLSYTCVPLFIMLTGYLCKDKQPNKQYYKKIIRIIIEYLICSIIICLFKIYFLDMKFTFLEFLKQIITFNMADYSWYINMYIGLFLLIPFFNILYNNIPSQLQKTLLIIFLIVIFSLTSTCLPFSWNYWVTAYPLMYYFMGCYLRDIKLHINKYWLIPIMLFMVIIEAILSMFNVTFFTIENHSNIFCVVICFCIFMLFYNNFVSKQNLLIKYIRKISNTSLSFFLLSFVFDELFKVLIFKRLQLNNFYDKLPHLLYIVPITIILSILSAFIVGLMSKYIIKVLKIFTNKFLNLLRKRI